MRARGRKPLVRLLVLALLAAGCTGPEPGGFAARDGVELLGTRGGTEGKVLLTEVYYRSAHPAQADEYVRLYNGTWSAVDLAGWRLQGGAWERAFPPGLRLGPGESLYVSRSAAAFRRLMGFDPAAEWDGDSDPRVPDMVPVAGTGAHLPDSGGQVLLLAPGGTVADAVAYGQTEYRGPGWRGWTARGTERGEVLDRARDESTVGPRSGGLYADDTDRAEDWWQGTDWMDLRSLRPGQSFFPYPTFPVRELVAYASPDTSYAVLSHLFREARRSIDLNMYQFENPQLAADLAAAARRGVRVRVLLEASWRPDLRDEAKWAAQRWVAAQLHAAGVEVRWQVKRAADGILGRYWLNHAKYGIVDGRQVFVQSENFTLNGVPVDPSTGNRGWGVLVDSPDLAQYLTRVFEFDANPALAEIRLHDPADHFFAPDPGYAPPPLPPAGSYPHPFPAIRVQGARVTPVLAPDHALMVSRGVIGLIRSARHTLLVEQQYIHYHWGFDSGSPDRTPNLFLREVVNAARRGVQVRVLVSDAFIDPSRPRDSSHTVAHLNRLAAAEGLDLQARIVRSDVARFTKVHNKGIVVDGRAVLVSSINWSATSPRLNREVGLIVEHPAVGRYYTDLFYYDWYDGSPPDYPLLSAVVPGYYVQIANPTGRPVDLSGWRLATGEAVWPLPAGTVLPPGQALTVTGDPRAFQLEFGRPAGVSGWHLQLRPERGWVELQAPDGRPVDTAAWGGAIPGWDLAPVPRQALCRPDVHRDTNTRLDWDLAPPRPGAAGCGGAVER